jgi:hypothetical protein
MSINLFFLLLIALLMGMFTYFSPDYTMLDKNKDIPQIELSHFTLYEISPKKIDHILEGEEGKKFETRYVVTSAKFSDNTKTMFHSLRANHVEYQNDLLTLNGDVRYVRQDGLEFRSKEGTYNTKESLIQTKGSFVITKNAHRIDGTTLNYNTKKDTVSADRVCGVYQLK